MKSQIIGSGELWRLAKGVVVSLLITSSAVAQDKPPIVGRAENCLRDRVQQVVSVEPDLEAAAKFLVEFACAEEVEGAARYDRNVLYVKAAGRMFKNFPANPANSKDPTFSTSVDATVDPNTGEVVVTDTGPSTAWNPMANALPQMGDQTSQLTGVVVPVPLRKLAGELVVAARKKQLSPIAGDSGE